MITPEELKLETNWFLKKISAYNAQPIVGIDEHMVKLFYDATQKIGDCVDRNEIVNHKGSSKSDDVLFDIDISCYRYHRSIMCTICNINIDINKSEYLAHVNGEQHKRNVSSMANGLKSNSDLTEPSNAVTSTSSPAQLCHGNGFQATNNVTTDEYFHLPTPRATRSTTPHSMSNARSTVSLVRELGKSMNDLNLNGAASGFAPRPIQTENGRDGLKSKNVDMIRNAIKLSFPRAKVYLYGSHHYGLADDSSDLNLYIDLDGQSYNLQRTKAIMAGRKETVESRLKRDKSNWKNVKSSQRLVLYPLVHATSVNSGVSCTFSFGTGLFVEANCLIRDYLNALPMAQSMIRFLKEWQSQTQHNQANTFAFSTYQLTILVIWYFQLWKYLPAVKTMQSSTNKFYCGDAQIDYKKPKALKPTTNQLENYLLDFFDFFGNQYSPRKDIISAFYGKLLKRNCTSDIDADNWVLCKYIKNANQSLWNEPHAHMYVHDVYLQSASPNVTADISSVALNAFRAQCRLTADFLRQSMLPQ